MFAIVFLNSQYRQNKKPAEAGSGCFGYKASPTSEIMRLAHIPHHWLRLQLL